MSLGDLSRINTNVQSMRALGQLNKTNSELGVRQMRLATGSRLNRAEDDSAGYTIANKLQAKTRGQAQALANIGDAKGMLTVGEGALNTTMDILQTMKEKAVQAANDTMGEDERTAIQGQLDALTAEIDDIFEDAEFNGTKLFDGDETLTDGKTGQRLSFQVGASSDDTFEVEIASMGAARLGTATEAATASSATTTDKSAGADYTEWITATAGDVTTNGAYTGDYTGELFFKKDGNNLLVSTEDSADGFADPVQSVDISGVGAGGTATAQGIVLTFTNAFADMVDGQGFSIDVSAAVEVDDDVPLDLNVTTLEGAQAAIDQIDGAIDKVNIATSSIGDSQARLSIKQENLDTSMTNYEAARSRIEDTDFAKEQMEIVKLQILQQTGIGSLAQANSGPQSVLSLINGG